LLQPTFTLHTAGSLHAFPDWATSLIRSLPVTCLRTLPTSVLLLLPLARHRPPNSFFLSACNPTDASSLQGN